PSRSVSTSAEVAARIPSMSCVRAAPTLGLANLTRCLHNFTQRMPAEAAPNAQSCLPAAGQRANDGWGRKSLLRRVRRMSVVGRAWDEGLSGRATAGGAPFFPRLIHSLLILLPVLLAPAA